MVLLVILFGLAGCAGSDDDGDSANEPSSKNGGGSKNDKDSSAPQTSSDGIEISEDIINATTWERSNVYIIRTDISVGSPLTIEAGTVIKFDLGASMSVDASGLIIARGTEADPIFFTSYRDDEHGGDTNGDGNTTLPATSDWNGVYTSGTIGAIFNYCHFLYGGESCSTLSLYQSRATVTNCVFAHNRGCTGNTNHAYYYGALSADTALLDTVITGNRFYDNDMPLSINQNYDLDDSNTFQDIAGTMTNRYNAIFFHMSYVSRNIRWLETEVAFVNTQFQGWCTIAADASITLGDNVVLKFTAGNSLHINNEANLPNHDGAGVHFTSFRDDTLKGDSNGDGDATVAAEGDWDGVGFYSLNLDPVNWPNIYYDNH